MNRFRASIFLIVHCFLALGQSNLSESESDSLWSVWNNDKNADTLRLNAINHITRLGFSLSETDTALLLIDHALELSENIGDEFYTAKSLETKAILLNNKSLKDEALELIKKAEKSYLRLGKEKEYAGILGTKARIISSLGDYENAVVLHKESLEIFRRINNREGEANALNNLGVCFVDRGLFDEGLKYLIPALEIQKELGDKNGLSSSLNNIGIVYARQGDFPKTLEYFQESLKIREETGEESSIASSLNNIGVVYSEMGNNDKALEYYERSIEIRKNIDDKKGLAGSLNNIGIIYQERGDLSTAMEYQLKSLKIREEIGDKNGISTSLVNIAGIYGEQNEDEKAIKYYWRSLDIAQEIGDVYSEAEALHNLASINIKLENFDSAQIYIDKVFGLRKEMGDKPGLIKLKHMIGELFLKTEQYDSSITVFNEGLEMAREIGDKHRECQLMTSLGQVYFKNGSMDAALKFLKPSYQLALELNILQLINSSSEYLHQVYEIKGMKDKAYDIYRIYNLTRDSIEKIDNQREVIRLEYKNEYEKKFTADSILAIEQEKVHRAELAAEHALNVRRKQQSYFLYGLIFLFAIFAAFIFNRYKVSNRQKDIITKQKSLVDKAFTELEDKNNKILDSIEYAKRIQNAILPPAKVIKEYLTESFIILIPKDVVAGDFYWLETLKGHVLFAVADCTGHGVPGAMVSVICNNGLNRSVREHSLIDPGQILDKTREIVISEFEKSEEDVKDGMDIALCSLKGNTLNFAGAHNPLVIVRKDSKNLEIIDPDKQPIGKFDNPQPYTTKSIELNEGDNIYIFSDGFQDQFGGEKGKKFMKSRFNKLLVNISQEPMYRQRELLLDAFNKWKGDEEQVDDVCVIGVRI